MERIRANEYGGWECDCGNDPNREGFYAIDADGREIEPVPTSWTTGWYACARCGQVIVAASGELLHRVEFVAGPLGPAT